MAKANKQLFRKGVSGFLHPYRYRVLSLAVLTVTQSLLQVAMAVLSQYVIDSALSASESLVFWGALLVADLLALVGVHALLVWYTGSTADRMVARLRQDILHTAVYSRDEALLDHHSGELLNRGMEDVYTLCDGAVNALPALVGQITCLAAAFVAVVLISAPVAGVLLVAAAAVGVTAACLRPVLKARHRLVREADEQVMSTMQEDLQKLELIQSMGAQEQIEQRFARRIANSLRVRFKRRLWSVSSNSVINAASQLSAGVLLLWGAARVASGGLSYGSLTAMLELLALFRGPVLGLSGLWTRLASVDVASERLRELLKPEQPVEAIACQPDVTGIVFENVTFSYPGDEVPVLQDFSYRFPLEGWTCLTGISGRGKTTIFKLILGLYAPQSGRIYLQTDRGEIPCTEATRSLFAYVPQDYALFSGTILENLQLVAPDVEQERLQQALDVARADFVWTLGDRLQTQVRENNAGLSKGQLQRLAIARAVLMERPVFLLDECTSALDAQTEEAVLRALHALGKRAILVTHRPEAVEALQDVISLSMEQ